jgi:hypothetical protein
VGGNGPKGAAVGAGFGVVTHENAVLIVFDCNDSFNKPKVGAMGMGRDD